MHADVLARGGLIWLLGDEGIMNSSNILGPLLEQSPICSLGQSVEFFVFVFILMIVHGGVNRSGSQVFPVLLPLSLL